jgi:hypothetical protein
MESLLYIELGEWFLFGALSAFASFSLISSRLLGPRRLVLFYQENMTTTCGSVGKLQPFGWALFLFESSHIAQTTKLVRLLCCHELENGSLGFDILPLYVYSSPSWNSHMNRSTLYIFLVLFCLIHLGFVLFSHVNWVCLLCTLLIV